MPGIKKSFSLFLAGIFVLSPSLNIFAETGSTVLYDKNYSKNIVSSVSEGSPQITVKSEKDSFKIGETFSVDFEISNNPGFSSYGFKVEYDGTVIKPVSASSEECQVEYSYNSKVKNKAIKNTDIKNAVKSKKENDFYFTGFCMSGSGKLTQTTGDGLLFTVDFKVVGDGKSKIDLIGFNDFILSDSDDAKIPVYVKSLIVTAGNGNSGKTDSKNGNTTEKTGKLSNLRNMRPDEDVWRAKVTVRALKKTGVIQILSLTRLQLCQLPSSLGIWLITHGRKTLLTLYLLLGLSRVLAGERLNPRNLPQGPILWLL